MFQLVHLVLCTTLEKRETLFFGVASDIEAVSLGSSPSSEHLVASGFVP